MTDMYKYEEMRSPLPAMLLLRRPRRNALISASGGLCASTSMIRAGTCSFRVPSLTCLGRQYLGVAADCITQTLKLFINVRPRCRFQG